MAQIKRASKAYSQRFESASGLETDPYLNRFLSRGVGSPLFVEQLSSLHWTESTTFSASTPFVVLARVDGRLSQSFAQLNRNVMLVKDAQNNVLQTSTNYCDFIWASDCRREQFLYNFCFLSQHFLKKKNQNKILISCFKWRLLPLCLSSFLLMCVVDAGQSAQSALCESINDIFTLFNKHLRMFVWHLRQQSLSILSRETVI